MIDRSRILDKMKDAGSHIFSVTFIKKDGSTRKMNVRFGVTKGVIGEDASDSAKQALQTWKENNPNLIRIFDVEANGFKTINLLTILSLKIDGKIYNVVN